MTNFHGAWPALITPFDSQDKVSVSTLRRLVDHLIGKGVGGFYVCGSTGEGIYMTTAERKLTLETTIEQVNKRVPVIAHIGCVAAADAAGLAHHAQEAGADGVASIIPPLYNNTTAIHDYYAGIAAAAPSTPLFTYIFGGPVDAVALMRTLMDIPTLAGGKYTGPNMFEFRRIIDLGEGKWTVFSGMDEECLFAALFGSSGNIGTTLNYHPGLYREIHAAVKAGDMARGTELQLQANRITAIMMEFGVMGSIKAAMSLLGFDCGRPRLPNLALPAERMQPLFQTLEAAGFSELAAI